MFTALRSKFDGLMHRFIGWLANGGRKYCIGSTAIHDHEQRLFGNSLPLLDIYGDLPISDPCEMEKKHHECVFSRIHAYPNWGPNTRNNCVSTCRLFIRFMMNPAKVIPEDIAVDNVYYWVQPPYEEPKVTTPEQDELFLYGEHSKNPLLQLRSMVVSVLDAAGAVREEVELERIPRRSIVDHGPKGMTAIIIGKRFKPRPVSIFSQGTIIIRAWNQVRDFHVAQLGIDEPMLLIKQIPTWDPERGAYSLALTRRGHYQAIHRYCMKTPGLEDVDPYDRRRASISRMVLIAIICNIPLEEVARRCGNTLQVLQEHYNRNFDLFNELFGQPIESLPDYLKTLIVREACRCLMNPNAFESRACIDILLQLLGRARLFNLFQEIQAAAYAYSRGMLSQAALGAAIPNQQSSPLTLPARACNLSAMFFQQHGIGIPNLGQRLIHQ